MRARKKRKIQNRRVSRFRARRSLLRGLISPDSIALTTHRCARSVSVCDGFFRRGYHSRMTRRDEIDEGPDESDIKRFSDVTRTCPACRADVYDDAELCWQCGHAFTASKSAPSKFTIVIVGVLILAFLFWYLRGLFF